MLKYQQAWVDALRYGKYKQGKGFLKQKLDNEKISKRLPKNTVVSFDSLFQTVPLSITKKVHLRSCTGKPINGFVPLRNSDLWENSTLTTMNDNTDITFKELADEIENNPDAFFINSLRSKLFYIRRSN